MERWQSYVVSLTDFSELWKYWICWHITLYINALVWTLRLRIHSCRVLVQHIWLLLRKTRSPSRRGGVGLISKHTNAETKNNNSGEDQQQFTALLCWLEYLPTEPFPNKDRHGGSSFFTPFRFSGSRGKGIQAEHKCPNSSFILRIKENMTKTKAAITWKRFMYTRWHPYQSHPICLALMKLVVICPYFLLRCVIRASSCEIREPHSDCCEKFCILLWGAV
jgi:hypothetical protein